MPSWKINSSKFAQFEKLFYLISVHTNAHVHHGQPLCMCSLKSFLCLIFQTVSCYTSWSSPFWLNCLASEPPGSFCPHLRTLDCRDLAFMWYSGPKLGSACFFHKHFTHRATSPQPYKPVHWLHWVFFLSDNQTCLTKVPVSLHVLHLPQLISQFCFHLLHFSRDGWFATKKVAYPQICLSIINPGNYF